MKPLTAVRFFRLNFWSARTNLHFDASPLVLAAAFPETKKAAVKGAKRQFIARVRCGHASMKRDVYIRVWAQAV